MANPHTSAASKTAATGRRRSGCRSSSRGASVLIPLPLPQHRLKKVPLLMGPNLGTDRLFKFPQMDFEMAIWEMTHLLIAPKKVFRSIFYQKRGCGPVASLLLLSGEF